MSEISFYVSIMCIIFLENTLSKHDPSNKKNENLPFEPALLTLLAISGYREHIRCVSYRTSLLYKCLHVGSLNSKDTFRHSPCFTNIGDIRTGSYNVFIHFNLYEIPVTDNASLTKFCLKVSDKARPKSACLVYCSVNLV